MRSAKCYVPCPRDALSGLEFCSKVGGVEKSGVGGNPDITGNRRVDRNLVWERVAAQSSATGECPAGVSRNIK